MFAGVVVVSCDCDAVVLLYGSWVSVGARRCGWHWELVVGRCLKVAVVVGTCCRHSKGGHSYISLDTVIWSKETLSIQPKIAWSTSSPT